jgi:ABC-type transporter lipoprotein component MlaA
MLFAFRAVSAVSRNANAVYIFSFSYFNNNIITAVTMVNDALRRQMGKKAKEFVRLLIN